MFDFKIMTSGNRIFLYSLNWPSVVFHIADHDVLAFCSFLQTSSPH